MAPRFFRFFTHCLLWSLGALLACWALALLNTLVTNGLVTFFSSVVGLLLWYVFFFGTFLSLLLLAGYVLTALLVELVNHVTRVPTGATAPELPAYALLGQFLTRYHAKHTPTAPHSTLTVNLLNFERALGFYLPKAAHLHSTWWTVASEHTQQWQRDGWQVTAVELLAQEPSVTFSSALPAAAACPRPGGRGH
jgi:hypothetical protein